jgi:hypothetical protein
MTIDLPREIEAQLKSRAQAQGVSIGQYIESLVAETNVRDKQVAEFRAAIAERVASLNSGDAVDGEEVMARLIAELAPR